MYSHVAVGGGICVAVLLVGITRRELRRRVGVLTVAVLGGGGTGVLVPLVGTSRRELRRRVSAFAFTVASGGRVGPDKST
jgi:hypothetical protein